ncbi:MAG: PilW family protein [Gammaproteobacteria bacterium]|nr:PilW family protein [Gammaproteobacteria bacterium]
MKTLLRTNRVTFQNLISLPRTKRTSHGFSIVELMVALVLSSLIMIGVIQIFISSNSTHRATEGLSRVQENGRFAMDFLTREIRMAGNMGCLRTVPIVNYVDSTNIQFDPTRGIFGFEASNSAPDDTISAVANPTNTTSGWGTTLDSNLVPGSGGVAGAIAGTDIIVVYSLGNTIPLRAPDYHNEANVFLDDGAAATAGLEIGDIVTIADCEKASIFQISSMNSSKTNLTHTNAANPVPGNVCSQWGSSCADKNQEHKYGPDAELAKLVTSVFYIARGAGGKPSLFRASLTPGSNQMRGEELVEGIENMQILYGEDTTSTTRSNGQPTTFLTASEVTNWSRVVNVRISLVAATENIQGTGVDMEPDTGTYLLTGATPETATEYDPVDDTRRRRVFNATVQLRNRGL